MTKQVMAFDRSVRRVDDDGHLHVERCVLSAAVVSPYWGSELKDSERLGLKPDVMYQVYRDADALRNAAASMNGKPIIEIHQPVSADEHPREITVGAVGNARFEDPDLVGELSIWDGDAIARIQDGSKRCVSAGYAYDIVPESGSINGQEYSLKMVNIRFNHLALVENPRVTTAIIGDSAHTPKTPENKSMAAHKPMSKAAKVAAALKSGRLAMDASEEDIKKCMDEETEEERAAREKEEAEKKAADEEAEAARKKAEEEEEAARKAKDEEEAEKDKKAQDAAIDSRIRVALDAQAANFRELRAAQDLVRPVVGDTFGMDSASAVLLYACKDQGIACDGVTDPAALTAIWRAGTAAKMPAPRPAMAADSASSPVFAGIATPKRL